MKKLSLLIILFSVSINANITENLVTEFEKSKGLETATYKQVIEYYKKLAVKFPQISMQEMGKTDADLPLHLITFNSEANESLADRYKSKSVLLINNGIHPGESDGIDATMMLFRDLATGVLKAPKNVIICTIPVYNIGGSLNRNSTSRTNQNGPLAYGFRGNARNYDLNRDFIKSDTLNAQSFVEIFHIVKPDVFIDNHVSNGADYQYTLTHLFTQHNKLGGSLGKYINDFLQPTLENALAKKSWDVTPYVNVFNRVPETGFSQFMDYPRYSTGYTSLFNVLGMMVETHMLKPYKKRVEGTYQLMASMIEIVDAESDNIRALRKDYYKGIYAQDKYTLNWQIDEDKSTTINFKGYQGIMIDSKVTNAQRLKYDRSKPFTKPMKYQNHFKPSVEITIPKAYIVPQGWHEIITLLKLNQVEMQPLVKDTMFQVESYKIGDFETRKTPYEGHYMHSKTNIIPNIHSHEFKIGDYLIPVNQPSIRYILETLEPQAPDSFFNWNFFDTILQQKEGFSPYVFEEKAEEILRADQVLNKEFNQKLKADEDFSKNWHAQLSWIHKHSKHYEKAHKQYPVYRVLKQFK
jgi:hypothetical protein